MTTFLLFSALTLAAVYRPILTRLSLGLSPYEKANLIRRFCAATIDALVVGTAAAGYGASQSMAYVLFAAAYISLREAVQGRSIGKFVCSLVVVDVETGQPCGWRASFSRSVLFVIPGANVAAAFLEMRTISQDPHGLRLGDRFALTQVVAGLWGQGSYPGRDAVPGGFY
jgi:hypothetical protein